MPSNSSMISRNRFGELCFVTIISKQALSSSQHAGYISNDVRVVGMTADGHEGGQGLDRFGHYPPRHSQYPLLVFTAKSNRV